MTSSVTSPPTSYGLLDELYRGRLRWDLLRPFPSQDTEQKQIGDAAVAAVGVVLREHVDPDAVDRTGRLPEGLGELLRAKGYFGLMIEPELGGLGLSGMNALRVLQAVASWSPGVASMLAFSNGLGSGNYLPLLADGPLRTLVREHVRTGTISGSADAEAHGAANRSRRTVAVPVEGGAAYLLTGEKVYIGNAPLAGFLDVSATVDHEGTQQIRVFFLKTDAPGVEVMRPQEFMGMHGAPVGGFRFDRVRVPAEQLLPASADEWRDEPELVRLAVRGRMLIIASPSLAIAKLCLSWSRNFVNRRTMDGRPLGEYEEIQRLVAQTAADVYAIESITEWGMLSGDLAEKAPELTAAKNLTSLACWRAVDRTVSLLAAEGIETARSKELRGAVPLPVERFARDARCLRVMGGVDFLLDYWTALSALDTAHGQRGDGAAQDDPGAEPSDDPALSARCREHLAEVQHQSRALADLSRHLISKHGDQLAEREHQLVLVGQIGSTLLGMAVVLARAAHQAEQGAPAGLELADIACTEDRNRLAGLWPQLAGEAQPDYAATSDRVLHSDHLDFLLDGVITDLPPSATATDLEPADD